MATPPKPPQDIETLRKRYNELALKRAGAEANLETATGHLERLKLEARESYGTDDLEQLRAKLDEMKRENERKREEYQRHLDEIEAKLGEVDRQYSQSRSA